MALNGGVNVKAILVLIKLALLISSGVFAGPAPGGGGVFDVTQFGAKPDGKSDNALALIRAWNAACKSTGTTAKLVIPTGNFKAGEVVFMGPCTSKVTVQLDGNLLASTDLSDFSMGVWITIQKVTDMVLTGGGTINGQGEANWRSNACKGSDCNNLLPDSLVVKFMTNFVMRGVKFVNSKGYHMKVNDCNGVTLDGLHITAPDESPNTDGIHISRTNGINITRSTIGTGDDCISIGEGSVNVNVFQVTCGPGHGISIGSLGKRAGEQNVKGITVTNCTLTGTTNGARIKSVHNSPKLTATSIVYQDIIMNHVQNPIIIDQNYQGRAGSGASNVQISDVHFRNIRGTTTSLAAVTLHCSSAVPCTGVELSNIDIAPAVGLTKFSALTSSCENAKASFTGRQNPTPCNGQKSGPAAPGNPLPPQKPSPVPTPPVKNPLPPKKPPPQKPSPVPTPPVKNPLPPKKPPPQSPSPPKKSPGKPQPPPKKKSPPPPPPSKGNKKNKGKTQKKSKKQGKKCKNGKCQ